MNNFFTGQTRTYITGILDRPMQLQRKGKSALSLSTVSTRYHRPCEGFPLVGNQGSTSELIDSEIVGSANELGEDLSVSCSDARFGHRFSHLHAYE